MFKTQAERFGAKFKSGRVSRVDLQSRPFRLFLESGEMLIFEASSSRQGLPRIYFAYRTSMIISEEA